MPEDTNSGLGQLGDSVLVACPGPLLYGEVVDGLLLSLDAALFTSVAHA